VTPYPLEGVVSWNMNTVCNYRCSYCTQRFLDDRKQWAKDLPAFLDAFAALPGDWEIKLSGGEPFRHPDFLGAVTRLANTGLRVSVVTNFSADRPTLAAFANATAHRPGVVSASLHLEHVEVEAFLDKARWFASLHAGSFCVTCVGTRQNLPWLSALGERFAPLAFKVQPEKQDRDVIAYTAPELEALKGLGGHNGTGFVAPSFQGLPCWAGSRYFIVDHRGEAYRCYPARRYREERLGNLLDGSFRLALDAAPCRYTYCNCTVPQQRGMVPLTPQEVLCPSPDA